MGAILVAQALAKKNKDSTSAPQIGGTNGDIHMHTAEELLAAHRAAQGFGAPSGGSTPAAPSTGPSDPPGGQVLPSAPDGGNVIPEPDDATIPGRRPRRGEAGYGVNLL